MSDFELELVIPGSWARLAGGDPELLFMTEMLFAQDCPEAAALPLNQWQIRGAGRTWCSFAFALMNSCRLLFLLAVFCCYGAARIAKKARVSAAQATPPLLFCRIYQRYQRGPLFRVAEVR